VWASLKKELNDFFESRLGLSGTLIEFKKVSLKVSFKYFLAICFTFLTKSGQKHFEHPSFVTPRLSNPIHPKPPHNEACEKVSRALTIESSVIPCKRIHHQQYVTYIMNLGACRSQKIFFNIHLDYAHTLTRHARKRNRRRTVAVRNSDNRYLRHHLASFRKDC